MLGHYVPVEGELKFLFLLLVTIGGGGGKKGLEQGGGP